MTATTQDLLCGNIKLDPWQFFFFVFSFHFWISPTDQIEKKIHYILHPSIHWWNRRVSNKYQITIHSKCHSIQHSYKKKGSKTIFAVIRNKTKEENFLTFSLEKKTNKIPTTKQRNVDINVFFIFTIFIHNFPLFICIIR